MCPWQKLNQKKAITQSILLQMFSKFKNLTCVKQWFTILQSLNGMKLMHSFKSYWSETKSGDPTTMDTDEKEDLIQGLP